MNIAEAKQGIKDTVEAYLTKDANGFPRIPTVKQRPLFMVGAPGIGKTAIMSQIAEELDLGLVSYSMTHHTRQSALGLPFIVHEEFEGFEYDASEYTMSETVASIYDYMRNSGQHKGILFLDEVNCVSETLYPSMLQFLQMKTFGRHRIPDDWIVVCAGNPPEYNRSVHEFDIVTLDRMRKIELEPDYGAWREYAINANIHPAILSFLEVKKECFYSVETTPEGKIFITARGWEDLSTTLSLFEELGKTVDDKLFAQFIQNPEICDQFSRYYKLFIKYRSDYKVEDILEGNVDPEIVARAQAAEFDERLALLSLILDNVATTLSESVFMERAVTVCRDTLKEYRPALENENATLLETVGEKIMQEENLLKKAMSLHTSVTDNDRIRKQGIDLLQGLMDEAKAVGKQEGAEGFAAIHYAYRGYVAELEQSVKASTQRLDYAFDFIEQTFGTDREMLVFITELTARQNTARFINRFGNERYYAHNEKLMVLEHKQQILDRIDEVTTNKPAAAEVPGASSEASAPAPVINSYNAYDHEAEGAGARAMQDYYRNAKFEYGFNSLCNMTLPEDMKGKAVLNLGCRRGKGTFKMSDRVGDNGRLVGIDWVKPYIDEANQRMDRAWKKSGLSHNNMEFHCAFPEDLMAAGLGDETFDMVFINSVVNLAFSPKKVYTEAFRVLKPGGMFVCETVLADGKRDPEVMQVARELGNSIQAAPYVKDFEEIVEGIGFSLRQYVNPVEVEPANGYKLSYRVKCAPSDEEVKFTAEVAVLVKPAK